MPTELTLRPATAADADELAAIHLASRRAAAMPPGVHPDAAVRDWMSRRLQEDEAWVAEVAGAAVGYARFTESWLDDLYVLPEHAGQGVGSALLDLVKARRPDGFCLWVFETNARALRFYEQRGLVGLEHTDGSATEEGAPDVRMAWPGRDPVGFLRRLIDDVDDELGDLLARRLALTRAVQVHKPDRSRDRQREQSVVERVGRRVPELGEASTARIVEVIIRESLAAVQPADQPDSG